MSETRQWQRARRPEQKEERRESILEAAGRLLDAEGLEGTGLNAIAREAGISKANIYRYFESREAALLQLFVRDFEIWMRMLADRLARLEEANDIEGIADAFTDTLIKRSRLCVLIGALASVLEHNVDATTVETFKRNLKDLVHEPVAALATAAPALSPEESYQFLAQALMAASGIWPHSHPAPVVQEVLKNPEFELFRFDFRETVEATATSLLRGMMQKGH